jgi:hypothetical protein
MNDHQMSDDDEEVKRVNQSGSKDNSASFNNDLYPSDEDLAMVGNVLTGKFSSNNCLFRTTKDVHSRLGHQECVQSKPN